MTSGECLCLISFATAPLTCSVRGGSEKFKMKIHVSSGIRTNTTPVHDRKVSAFDRTGQRSPCKWNQARPFTCSHSFLDPRYDESYKALYIYSRSIAFRALLRALLKPHQRHRGPDPHSLLVFAGNLQPYGLNSFPDWRNITCQMRCLYDFAFDL